ncbi:MAG TPA: helix-turn-helix transcriptional regulator [Solirubrobacterales bacterium]|nr:helix-turn-helix transcriptional regulator [Solirubrobacterales bacterium]
MASLSGADLKAALDFVAEAHEFESIDEFRIGIQPGLLRLVPADLAGYNEVDPGGSAFVITHPVQVPDSVNAELPRLAHEHPLIVAQANGDPCAYKISDFLSQRQFHSLELYAELYKQIDAEDQIAFGLPGPTVIGIALNRASRSFSERDRDLLDLLRPHLAQAHRRVLERERATAAMAALERGLSERDAAVALVDAGGAIVFASGRAPRLLADYFPEARGRGVALPSLVAEWLAAPAGTAGPVPLEVGAEHGTLTLRADPEPSGGWLLTLDEELFPTPERLRGLGLTHRQAEVLSLLASGAGVAGIAADLYLSPATVRKHLENVYTRLGVHTRAEAIARARTA